MLIVPQPNSACRFWRQKKTTKTTGLRIVDFQARVTSHLTTVSRNGLTKTNKLHTSKRTNKWTEEQMNKQEDNQQTYHNKTTTWMNEKSEREKEEARDEQTNKHQIGFCSKQWKHVEGRRVGKSLCSVITSESGLSWSQLSVGVLHWNFVQWERKSSWDSAAFPQQMEGVPGYPPP